MGAAEMRAAVVDRYGPAEVVRVAKVARPEQRRDAVLVRVKAAAVTSADARIRAARFPPGFGAPARLVFGITRPRRKILGSCLSGVVESVGPGVTDMAPGDEVCAMVGMRFGAHAEYVVVPAKKLVRLPKGVSHEDAAGVTFGGTTALHFLRDKASVGPGMAVLVNGASGAIGTNAVQLARHMGATVTGVCSARNAALVTDLGAHHVIDHTVMDLTAADAAGVGRYDLVLDTVGNLSMDSGRRLLNDGGVLALAVAGLGETILARGNVVAGSSRERVSDIEYLVGLVGDGQLRVVHDTTHARPLTLDDIVEAHRRIDSGRKVGNIVIHP